MTKLFMLTGPEYHPDDWRCSYEIFQRSPTDGISDGKHAVGMERNQWPPLEQVREWAARKLVSGQVVPSSTGRYVNLIALIDEILVSQATTPSSPPSTRASEQELPDHPHRSVNPDS
jgi:hypothetical protein